MNNLTSQITAISLGMKTLSLINFILVQKTLFLDMHGEPQITVTGMNKFHKLSLPFKQVRIKLLLWIKFT